MSISLLRLFLNTLDTFLMKEGLSGSGAITGAESLFGEFSGDDGEG